jgi:hypothetical protein
MIKIIYLLALLPTLSNANSWWISSDFGAVHIAIVKPHEITSNKFQYWQDFNANKTPHAIASYDGSRLAIWLPELGGYCYSDKETYRTMKVNGKPLNFSENCNIGYTKLVPVSQREKDYIFRQFKDGSNVLIGSYSFSAMGFNKTIKQLSPAFTENTM